MKFDNATEDYFDHLSFTIPDNYRIDQLFFTDFSAEEIGIDDPVLIVRIQADFTSSDFGFDSTNTENIVFSSEFTLHRLSKLVNVDEQLEVANGFLDQGKYFLC